MATTNYDDNGIRFQYPADWELEEADDDLRTMISVQSPDGLIFVLVTLDPDRPLPSEMVDEAVSAMRDEYPDLGTIPAIEEIGGQRTVGQDLEFSSLDMLNACIIRAFRTSKKTILLFGQWASMDLDDEEPEEIVRTVCRSFRETGSA